MGRIYPISSGIRVARIIRGLSQRELGEEIRENQGFVSRIERGVVVRVTEDRAEAIAAALDVPVEELFEPSEDE